VALPKVDSAEHVRAIAEIVGELEAERGMASGTTRLVAMVETAAALFRIAEIARATLASSGSIWGPRILHYRPACCRRPRGS
jgi:citrate lyase subunit beta/citryl-CoA lyase